MLAAGGQLRSKRLQINTSCAVMASRPNTAPCPRILYGTAFKGDQTKELVLKALRLGYRGIDTAGVTNNYNEAQAGEAIQQLINEGVVQRHELYVCLLKPDIIRPSFMLIPHLRSKPNSPPANPAATPPSTPTTPPRR